MELESLVVNIKANGEQFAKDMETAAKSTSRFGSIAKGAMAVASAGIGVAMSVGGAAAAIFKHGAESTIDWASALDDFGDVTGASAQEAASWSLVARKAGIDTEALAKSYAVMSKGIVDKTSDVTQAIEGLGVSTRDGNGSLRSMGDLMPDLASKLNSLPDGAEKTALMMQIFGKRGLELNDMMEIVAKGGLVDAEQAIQKFGLAIPPDRLESIINFSRNLEQLKMAFSGFGNIIGGGAIAIALPVVNALMAQLGVILPALQQGMTNLTPLFSQLGNGISEFVSGNVNAGISLITGFVNGITAMLPQIAPVITTIITALSEALLGLLPSILNLGLTIIVTLITGIAGSIPTIIPALVQCLIDLVMVIINNVGVFIQAAVSIILALVEGLSTALPSLIEAMPTIIMTILTALINALPLILDAGIKIVFALANGIVATIPALVVAVVTLVVMLKSKLTELVSQAPAIGRNIVDGLWKGLRDSWAGFTQNVSALVNTLITKLKSLLGIASPSKVFAKIGNFMALGLSNGFTDGLAGMPELSGEAILTKSYSSIGNFTNNNDDVVSAINSLGSQKQITASQIAIAVRDALLQAGIGG